MERLILNSVKAFVTLVATAGVLAGCTPKKAAAGPAGGPPVVQVVAVEARRQPVAEKISLVGNLLANESVEIKSEIDGTVREIKFQEGERVEKGQLLIQIEDSKLAASVAEAEANYQLSKANYDRSQQLFRDKLIAKSEADEVSATFHAKEADLNLKREQLRDTKIVAPFAGIVGARNVSPGQVISKNTVLTWITDYDPIKIEINVPERFAGEAKLGQAIDLRIAALAGKTFHGEVYFIAPAIDPNTRTLLVKAKVPNGESQLKPGMFANIDLTLKLRENAVVVPEAALARVMDQDRAMIFIVDGEGAAQMKPVQLGVHLAGQVEVLNGLQGGETVIVEGTQKIGPGSKVKLAPAEAAAPYLQTNAPAHS